MPTSQQHFWVRKKIFLRCKAHSVRHTSLTFTWVKLCKRPEVTWNFYLTFLNNAINDCKAFPSLDGMACSYPCHDQLQFLPEHWQAKRYWSSWDLQKLNLLENNSNNSRSNMKSQIKNKKNRSISSWNY